MAVPAQIPFEECALVIYIALTAEEQLCWDDNADPLFRQDLRWPNWLARPTPGGAIRRLKQFWEDMDGNDRIVKVLRMRLTSEGLIHFTHRRWLITEACRIDGLKYSIIVRSLDRLSHLHGQLLYSLEEVPALEIHLPSESGPSIGDV